MILSGLVAVEFLQFLIASATERGEVRVQFVNTVDLADDFAGGWVLLVRNCGSKLLVESLGY